MQYSSIVRYIFYFSVVFLIFSLILYSLPVLVVIGVIFFLVMGFLWLLNSVFNKINKKIEESKYDEDGLRKTKASVVDIKPSDKEEK
ncbi:MAG: hypothetical protein ACP5QT_08520 [Brevinematia bacterium]